MENQSNPRISIITGIKSDRHDGNLYHATITINGETFISETLYPQDQAEALVKQKGVDFLNSIIQYRSKNLFLQYMDQEQKERKGLSKYLAWLRSRRLPWNT